MSLKDTLIYLYPNDSSFIRKDIQFLSDEFEVIEQRVDWSHLKGHLPFLLIKQLLFLLKYQPHSKAVFVMFAGYWSLLPALLGKLLKKPVYIILGGTECCSYPHLDYGSLRKPIFKLIIHWSLQLATKLLPVHESLASYKVSYDQRAKIKEQGFLAFFPNLKTTWQAIHNGFDCDFFSSNSIPKLKNSFLSLAKVSTKKTFELKGFDIVVNLAKEFKNCTFILVGISKEISSTIEPLANLFFYEFIPKEDFKSLLQQTEFYLQLSISEGFPNSLCEAMLCNCIPIGSTITSIPDIIGESGFLIKHRNLEEIKHEIKHILQLNEDEKKERAENARLRIREKYSIIKRKKAFMNLLN